MWSCVRGPVTNRSGGVVCGILREVVHNQLIWVCGWFGRVFSNIRATAKITRTSFPLSQERDQVADLASASESVCLSCLMCPHGKYTLVCFSLLGEYSWGYSPKRRDWVSVESFRYKPDEAYTHHNITPEWYGQALILFSCISSQNRGWSIAITLLY